MGLCEYGADVLFEHQGNVLSRLAECCVGECSEDIEAGFSFSADVCIYGGRVGVGYGCVVL